MTPLRTVVKRLFVSRDGNANGQKLVAVNREPKWGPWTMMMPWIAMAHLFIAGAQMLAAWLRPSRSFVNPFYSERTTLPSPFWEKIYCPTQFNPLFVSLERI